MESAPRLTTRPFPKPSRYAKWIAIGIPIAVSLPMAWISLMKLALLLVGAYTLVTTARTSALAGSSFWKSESGLITLAVLWFGVSVSWSIAPLSFAAFAWVKHAKLLSIPLLLLVLTHTGTARSAMRSFLCAQFTVMVLSWLLYVGVPLPSISYIKEIGPIVFAESYIDQGVMFAISSAAAWHLRQERLLPGWMTMFMTALGLGNVVLLLPSRTGILVVIGLLGLAIWWAAPRRARVIAIVTMIAGTLLASTYLGSNSRNSVATVIAEVQQFRQQGDTNTSAGWRLKAWSDSTQGILTAPILGHGTGSFVPAVDTAHRNENAEPTMTNYSSNPHQEFLLWGIELGLMGPVLLAMIFVRIGTKYQNQAPAVHHATVSITLVAVAACMFNSALYDDLIGDFICVSLGLCLAYGNSEAIERAQTKQ